MNLSRVLRLFADEGSNLERAAVLAGFSIFVVSLFGYWVSPIVPFDWGPSARSQAVGEVFTRELSASPWDGYINSQLKINYPQDIESGSTANLSITISQRQVFRPNPGYSDMALGSDRPPPQTLSELQWPIAILLEGEPESIREIPKGASLPVTKIFSAKVSGTSDVERFILKLKNFDGLDNPDRNLSPDFLPSEERLSLDINGKMTTQNPRSDIVLTVHVYKFGIPVKRWELLTLAGGIAGFLLSCAAFTNFTSRLWQSMRSQPSASWEQGSLVLPHGTNIRATDEDGRIHVGQIRDGLWAVEGTNYLGPSDALTGLNFRKKRRIKKKDVANYWEIKREADNVWKKMVTLI